MDKNKDKESNQLFVYSKSNYACFATIIIMLLNFFENIEK